MGAVIRLAGVELGGTKSIAVLAAGGKILDRVTLPTRGPDETLALLHERIAGWHAESPLAAIGIASFGPLQLDASRPNFGEMLATPKAGWSGARIAHDIVGALDCPFAIDTDVTGAALAEFQWGAGQGCASLCYVTIGTGVGGGILTDGGPVHGAMHPEIGHLRLRREPSDPFPGICPFHGDCVEGLVGGPALAARFGRDPASVPDADPAWQNVAADLAELCGALLLTISAQRILFGGSVLLLRPFLLPRIRELLVARLGSYLPFLSGEAADDIVQIAGLGSEAGPIGALALAARRLQ